MRAVDWLRRLGVRLFHEVAYGVGRRVVISAVDPDGVRFFGVLPHRLHLNWIRGGVTEPLTTQSLRDLIVPGDTVIDVGVYLGVHTVIAADAVGPSGHVWSVEPDPLSIQSVRKTLRHNGLEDRVTLIEAAAGSFDSTSKLMRNRTDLSQTSLVGSGRSLEVKVLALDDHLPGADLVKIDVEGGEMAAIDGMQRILSEARILIVECAPEHLRRAGVTPDQLVDRVCSLGFSKIVVNDDIRGVTDIWPAEIASPYVNLVCSR